MKNLITSALNKSGQEEPKSIEDFFMDDNNFVDIEKENNVIYKDINILVLSKKQLGKISKFLSIYYCYFYLHDI